MPKEPAPTPRSRNPRGRGDQLRTQILRAVERLLGEEARMRELSLSLREVAREVGITPPSIYLHFADKDELAWAVVQDGYDTLADELRAAGARAAEQSDDPFERLRAQGHAYCAFAMDNPGLSRLMFGADPLRWAPEGELNHPAAPVMQCWQETLTACARSGLVIPNDIAHAAMAYWSALHGRIVLALTYPSAQENQTIASYVDELVDTMGALAGPKGAAS